MPNTIVSASNIRRSCNEQLLLANVSLDIQPGISPLIGESGSGKSLFLRSLAMLDPLATGTIGFLGEVVTQERVPEYRAACMYLQQRPTLFEGTVRENLERPYELLAHKAKAFNQTAIGKWLTRIGRNVDFLNKHTSELSGGESQIACLLRAIQLDPLVLLLDEPTAALDESSVNAIEKIIIDWSLRFQTRSVVWVTHDLRQAKRITTGLIHRMSQGQLTTEGN